MPKDRPDFSQAVIPSMPVVGEGQIPWYMSEGKLVTGGETYDLINYEVPDTFELHVCSGVVSCGTPRSQRYDLRQTPAGSWKSPIAYSDPDGAWIREERVYDNDIETEGQCVIPGNAWGSYLILLINESNIDKVRFYAEYSAISMNKIDVDVYYEGGWHDVYEGAWNDEEWVEKAIPAGVKLVSKARVRIYNDYPVSGGCHIFEFQFNTFEVTPQEGIWFDTHAIIPYTAEAPYIVEPKAKFVVKVYNDDDLDSNMSVALAGFLQPAVL
ncbi:hypothetical protein ES708_14949 [subsurface metagenome]